MSLDFPIAIFTFRIDFIVSIRIERFSFLVKTLHFLSPFLSVFYRLFPPLASKQTSKPSRDGLVLRGQTNGVGRAQSFPTRRWPVRFYLVVSLHEALGPPLAFPDDDGTAHTFFESKTMQRCGRTQKIQRETVTRRCNRTEHARKKRLTFRTIPYFQTTQSHACRAKFDILTAMHSIPRTTLACPGNTTHTNISKQKLYAKHSRGHSAATAPNMPSTGASN